MSAIQVSTAFASLFPEIIGEVSADHLNNYNDLIIIPGINARVDFVSFN